MELSCLAEVDFVQLKDYQEKCVFYRVNGKCQLMIKFSCTHCGHSYRIPDEYAGKRVKCKGCGTVNTIPAVDTEKNVIGSGDSIAAYNSLLQELLKDEQQAPPLETETTKG